MDNLRVFRYTLAEIPELLEQLIVAMQLSRCIIFDAPMGAGKTTLIRALCLRLGTQDQVNSPTFSIINHYKTTRGENIYHMDWYRLNSVHDAIEAGVEDCLQETDAYQFIEWPERAYELLPKPHWHIRIEMIDADTREMQLEFVD